MKGVLKWPLLIAVIVVVGRVVLERAGVPESVTNFLSAAVLHLLIVPLYLAVKIGGAGVPNPYRTLFKSITVYSAAVRAMIMLTYWLAYIFQWPETRFSTQAGGVVGEGITPMDAIVLRPLVAALAWIFSSIVVGGVLGSIVIAVRRRMVTSPSSS